MINQKVNWTIYSWENKDSHPPCAGKYMIFREKCKKMHWEQWNGSGWSSSNNERLQWCSIDDPIIDENHRRMFDDNIFPVIGGKFDVRDPHSPKILKRCGTRVEAESVLRSYYTKQVLPKSTDALYLVDVKPLGKPHLRERLEVVIRKILGVAGEINSESTFGELDMDSLDSVEIIVECEKTFDVVIGDSMIDLLFNMTVEEFYRFIVELIKISD